MKEIIEIIWNFIKAHYKEFAVFATIAVLAIALLQTCNTNKKLNNEVDSLKQNEKALMMEISDSQGKVNELEMSYETLQQFNDEITKKLKNAQTQLGVKDKNIKNLQYMLSQYKIRDTLIITKFDTIFKDPDFMIDTILGDSLWLSAHLWMAYPNDIYIDVDARSEKSVIISTERQTVNPPKKFFLFRWFQKKHTVTTVDIYEENPFIISQKNRFIKITE